MSGASLTMVLADILGRPVAPADRSRAVTHVLDWLACAYGGRRTEQGDALMRWADRFAQPGDHFVVGHPGLSRDSALLINAGLANILEMDDLHRTAILHPGPVVIPAVLAVGEQRNLTAAQMLDAVVIGYEAMIRIGRSFGQAHYRFWHNTATAGTFGAAAAVTHLLGGSATDMAHALGHAGTQSAGLWQTRHEPSMSKQLHTGRAAHGGLIAAELAMAGFTAPMAILEGEQGLYAAMCPDAIPGQVTENPDGAWVIHRVSFKPWPACRHAHATIDAALVIRDQLDQAGQNWEAIESVSVRSYEEAIRFCDKPDPGDDVAARFSLQHAVAVCLARGAPRLSDFDLNARADTTLQSLRQRVGVKADAAISQLFPAHYGAVVTARLKDGTVHEVSCRDALGDPDNPVSDARLVDKHMGLFTWGGLDTDQAHRLMQHVGAIQDGGSMAAWWQTLAAMQIQ